MEIRQRKNVEEIKEDINKQHQQVNENPVNDRNDDDVLVSLQILFLLIISILIASLVFFYSYSNGNNDYNDYNAMKMKPFNFELRLSLIDIYLGRDHTLTINRQGN